MDGESGKKYLEGYLTKTDSIFKDYLDQKIDEAKKMGILPSKLLSSFAGIARKGKKIRGSLVVLGYKAAGGRDEKAILDLSLFIELLHTGLLVHDDIQDRGDVRRGLPTIHKHYEDIAHRLNLGSESKHYGLSLALNAGISAYYLSWDKLFSSSFPTKRIVKAGKIIADYVVRVTHGQALDVSNIFVNNVNQKELLNILRYKTAEYTGVLPLLVGAILAGKEDEEYLSAMKSYGLCLGWAFQIQDDILGTFGDEEKLGKSVGIDLREGKVTLLVLHLMKNGIQRQKAFLARVLGNKSITKEDVKKMQEIFKKAGSLDYVVKLGWNYVKKGEKYIPQIAESSKLQKTFSSLLHFMMERAM